MNQELIDIKQCQIQNRIYVFEVYKGMEFRKAEHLFNGKLYEDIVEIKAFRITVKEVTMNTGGSQTIVPYDFGFCTSRTGEFKSAIEGMMTLCKDLEKMRSYMVSLRDRFAVAMDRDAVRALKKQYKLYDTKPVNARRSYNYQLPQLHR